MKKKKQLKMLLYLISGTDKSRHSIYLLRGKFPYAFPILSISKENSCVWLYELSLTKIAVPVLCFSKERQSFISQVTSRYEKDRFH